MDVIYGLIPGMIFMGVVAVGILFWAARNGQYDDMEGEAHRILMDDDLDQPLEQQRDAESAAEVDADTDKKTARKADQRMPD